MSDLDFFQQLTRRREAEQAQQLDRARAAATETGKEPFDLDRLEQLLDTTTDLGTLPPRSDRQRRWEEKYYLGHAEVRTLAEFAALMADLDASR